MNIHECIWFDPARSSRGALCAESLSRTALLLPHTTTNGGTEYYSFTNLEDIL